MSQNQDSEETKVSGINWESPFLRDFLTRLLLIILLPHPFFWIPAWIQMGLDKAGVDLGSLRWA
ncbi:MAG: hypothetical protein ACTSXP_09190, partial [Promethearchaeota archaeon]